jgi:hypothetical protein
MRLSTRSARSTRSGTTTRTTELELSSFALNSTTFLRWEAVAFTFLSKQDLEAWLATVDHSDKLLIVFARHLDELLEHAQAAGRKIRPQDAAVALLKATADEEAAEWRDYRLAA